MITDYRSAVAYLDEHIGLGVKPGLERISALLDLLANPESGYPVIHVAGSNGKTSTVRMAASLLSGHGLTPGTFTSPHLQRVEERYEHGLHPMTADEFTLALSELAPIADLAGERLGEGITYFELTAALAHTWFADRAVDAAVVEVGLGGRLDATNAVRSDVAVVTTIGLEHTEYLGNTIEEIAAEKLAILDEGAALVTGHLQPVALEVAEDVAGDRAAQWFRRGVEYDVVDVEPIERGWRFDVRSAFGEYDDIELNLLGRHQVDNFVTALASVEALFGRSIDEAGVREAAATVKTPGRLEVVGDEPMLVLDGAHNPHTMAVLGQAMRSELGGNTWQLVIGLMVDKDAASMLGELGGVVAGVHTAAADSARALGAGELERVAAETLDVPVQAHESVAAALTAAIATGDPVLVTGSLYVVGEARDALGL